MQLAEQIIGIGKKIQQNGFVAATDGNISCRADDISYYITASGKRKDSLTIADILRINQRGENLEGSAKPSSEFKLHTFIYKQRNDVSAVIHAHPKHSLIFAAGFHTLDVPVLPEVILTIGRIPLCEYGTPSTEELPDSLSPYVEYANVFLLKNHGVVTTGKSLEEAYNRLEKLEHYAEIMAKLYSLGNPRFLSKTVLKKLYDTAEKSYGIVLHQKNRYTY